MNSWSVWVFNAMMVLMLLYRCETWTVQRRQVFISKLQAFEMMCLRKVQGVTRMDRVRNEEAREALGQETVIEMVKEKQRKWKVKLEQMKYDRLVKVVYEEKPKGKRPRGRPRNRWCENLS